MSQTRRAFLTASLLAASPAFAQPTGAARVALTTAQGVIVLELETAKAPITAGNFLKYVDRRLYDGAAFYRASTPPVGPKTSGLLQGGLQNDPKKVLPPIAHETTAQTGLSHVDGTISMGRHAPGTAQADWFICVGDQPYLNADSGSPGFAAFGRVVEGMDLVKTLLALPVDPERGEGSMKGEMLVSPVRIATARRVP
ncbi:peptidylprolyl isomerase [Phenylobacterium sp.]|jgi:peptidyl-prolyl cis-trans isomerase A (cyclophilin A)|uniref:peptidylprolyl isomerase n=1 Tax=Phenylobacterium sp. TaxID=1871053 RepID=UPI003784CEFC